MWLVTESGTSACHQIVIIFSDPPLAAPNTPTDDSNATQKDGTANTTNNTTNNLLVAVAEATATAAVAVLRGR